MPLPLDLEIFWPLSSRNISIHELLGRRAAGDLADRVVERRLGEMVLAVHLVIHAQRRPAHAHVGLPLQLAMPAGDRNGLLAAIFLDIGDGALGHVVATTLASSTLPERGLTGRNGE